MPANVAAAIKDIQARYTHPGEKPYFSSFTVEYKNAGFQMHHSEGSQVTYIYGDNQITGEIASENNYAGEKIGHGPKLPAGTVAIVVSYYQGYYMSLYCVGEIGLEASKGALS